MPGESHTPLHPTYRCITCGVTVDSQIVIYRAFNYGRCHCGGELRAIPSLHNQTIRQKINL